MPPIDKLKENAISVARDILFHVPFADFSDLKRNQVFEHNDEEIAKKLDLLRDTKLADMDFELRGDEELPIFKIKGVNHQIPFSMRTSSRELRGMRLIDLLIKEKETNSTLSMHDAIVKFMRNPSTAQPGFQAEELVHHFGMSQKHYKLFVSLVVDRINNKFQGPLFEEGASQSKKLIELREKRFDLELKLTGIKQNGTPIDPEADREQVIEDTTKEIEALTTEINNIRATILTDAELDSLYDATYQSALEVSYDTEGDIKTIDAEVRILEEMNFVGRFKHANEIKKECDGFLKTLEKKNFLTIQKQKML